MGTVWILSPTTVTFRGGFVSKPIRLYMIDATDQGLICQHVKSAFNINTLFKFIKAHPENDSVDAKRVIDAIKHNGRMFVFMDKDVKKFHFSREELMKEVNHYQTIHNVISNI